MPRGEPKRTTEPINSSPTPRDADADGVPVGALGDLDVVSFHATKPFAIGEGGAVLARDEDLLARVEQATNFGLRPDGQVAMAGGLNASRRLELRISSTTTPPTRRNSSAASSPFG